MKRTNRLLSFILSVVMLISIIVGIPFSASANVNGINAFKDELRQKGFPESYIYDLAKLHQLHPTWDFEVLNTKLDWEAAVEGEYSYHKQLIENTVSPWYFCDCSQCKLSDGSYKVRENPNWVGASKNAVRYYLDPRNFLNEQYIFQFESSLYNELETVSGVEQIISSTWMANSNITYKDAKGNDITFYLNDETIKYSEAIMKAAKDSGMSAYFLASKIVQEVGGKNPTAGGASGTFSGYEGIYNYYNIGANTGAADGLRWASYQPEEGALTTTKSSCNIRSQAWQSTNPNNSLGIVEAGTTVNIISETEKQSDGYTWCLVETTLRNGEYVKGYIRSDLIKFPNKYNRPWTNPYLSIYNGAKKIADGFAKYQFTGYLQKFNVNNVEGNNLHTREYMANIRGAVAEGNRIYKANKNANSLDNIRTFYIPVFNNMPEKLNSEIENLKIVDIASTSLTYSLDAVDNAIRYEYRVSNNTKGSSFSGQRPTNTIQLNNLTAGNNYTVRVRAVCLDPVTNLEYTGQYIEIKNTTTSLTGGWKLLDNEWYYYDNECLTYSNGWKLIDNNWYYFYPNGRMARNNEISDSFGVCNLDNNGHMIKNNWGYTASGWRYYNEQGYAVYSTTIGEGEDVYHINDNGYLVVNSWMKDEGGAYYIGSNGKRLKNDTARDDRGVLYLDENGRIYKSKGWCLTEVGWIFIEDNGYLLTNSIIRDSHGLVYLDGNGKMTSNHWATIEKNRYYINNDGYVVTDAFIEDSVDLCYVGSDGVAVKNRWIYSDKGWMYFDKSGHILRNGIADDSHGSVYLDENGLMRGEGWVHLDDYWICLDSNGYLIKDTLIAAYYGYCYVDGNGIMSANRWSYTNDSWRYFNEAGYMVTNSMVRDYWGWCYVNGNGEMLTSRWAYANDAWRYFDEYGHMVTNSMVRDYWGWCYVNDNGEMITSRWVYVDGGWRNFDSYGHMRTNQFVNDYHGTCYVGDDGKMVYDKWITDQNGKHYIDSNGYLV